MKHSKRSKHNLSHARLLTGDMGQLLPIGCVEVLPGDTFQHATSLLVRASPLQTPPMHPVKMRVHHFFVPTRILWENFEDFITGGPDGNDNSIPPFMSFAPGDRGVVTVGSLANHLGLPVGYDGEASALPFRAYAAIWNEYYRDQDLQVKIGLEKTEDEDTITNIDLQRVAWEKDYFTSARPWEQKGDDVTIPLGGTAPLDFSASSGGTTSTAFERAIFSQATDGVPRSFTALGSAITAGTGNNTGGADFVGTTQGNVSGTADLTGLTGAVADLTQASVIGINALREAFALQRYKEARARYGSRFTEYLAYLGIRSSDSRLQRPEYLGGGVQNLQFSEVLQTAEGLAGGVGSLYGHGIGAVRSNRYRKFFEEHGYVISLAYILPKTMYQQGVHRMWSRNVKESYWQKELQHIGQQAVLNKEIFWEHALPDAPFGYQDRYDEYRRCESQVSGLFATTLNDWHFGRIFANDVTLNADFVQATPAKRPFQDQESDVLWIQVYHQLVARRLVAQTGTSFIL